ncbi:hypothetical protein F751_6265 [Auxenochlorella protothecoides]|uniref:Uncharacterized protein n=1 Tax=Auxenochlorella protothecoides TaxID=3075 RepID=A0A087SK60_AUXPR|nr:hypothetical protein F751_6265 [Auxenochlorella protothecoides]KFM26114.1 hypothetical protein F751_6265 [Auxenochlorella protothecoides]
MVQGDGMHILRQLMQLEQERAVYMAGRRALSERRGESVVVTGCYCGNPAEGGVPALTHPLGQPGFRDGATQDLGRLKPQGGGAGAERRRRGASVVDGLQLQPAPSCAEELHRGQDWGCQRRFGDFLVTSTPHAYLEVTACEPDTQAGHAA